MTRFQGVFSNLTAHSATELEKRSIAPQKHHRLDPAADLPSVEAAGFFSFVGTVPPAPFAQDPSCPAAPNLSPASPPRRLLRLWRMPSASIPSMRCAD